MNENIAALYLYVIFRPRTYKQLKKAVDEYCDSVFDVEFTTTEIIMNHFLGFSNPDFKQEKITLDDLQWSMRLYFI